MRISNATYSIGDLFSKITMCSLDCYEVVTNLVI